MKKIFQRTIWLLLLASASLNASALTNKKELQTSDASTATFAALSNLSASEVLSLTPEKYRAQTGERLSLKDRISLRLMQKSIRKHLKYGDEFQIADVVSDNKFHFMIGPFLLGLFLGLIGFLICLAFKDRKSALISGGIGWGIAIVLVLILLVG